MVQDRYGNQYFPEDAITVLDPDLNYDSDVFEDRLGLKLSDYDRSKYAAAYEADFGAGADWPMVAYELLQDLIPFSAIAAVFFAGDRLEKSMHAWSRMVTQLLDCIPPYGFTDANGAALLALEAVFSKTSHKDVKLKGYAWIDEEMGFFDSKDRATALVETISELNEIQPRKEQFGVGLHSKPTFLFKFEADGEIVMVAVREKEARVIGAE